MIEREIENLLEQKFEYFGWNHKVGSKGRMVYRQNPKTEDERKKISPYHPDFMLYLDETSPRPDIIIETKKPKQDLKKALDQAIEYAKILDTPIVCVYDGTTFKTHHLNTGSSLYINDVEVQDLLQPKYIKKFITENTNKIYTIDSVTIKSRNDLISVFKYANNQLRKAGITSGMERFTEFANLLFLKLISEESYNNIQIPDYIKWDSYKNKIGNELLEYINNVVIKKLNNLYLSSNQDPLFTPLIIKDTIALKKIIDKLSGLSLSNIETDIKGDAFEYFIQKYNSGNKDLGEYFTPRHIVNFIVKTVKPKYGEKIYDPFCGTGGMLISAFKQIYSNLEQQGILTEPVLKDLQQNTLYGSEISSTAKIAKMNMILTGDGHNNITRQNTLLNKIENKFDVVITNIPFSQEGVEMDLYPVKSNKGDSQCIQHAVLSLKHKSTSRGMIIVPEGVLNNRELKETREWLLKNNYLKGIISLPSGVFLPYTDSKTSILCVTAKESYENDKIFFYRVKNDGYTLTSRRRKKEGINDFDQFMSLNPFEPEFFDTEENDKLRFVDKKVILNNPNYSLMYFKYDNRVPEDSIMLKDIIEEVRITNSQNYPTVTVSNNSYFGITDPFEFWGENFESVTSKDNSDYKVVKPKMFAYNPSRANVGSIGLNLTGKCVSVSKMYVTFKVKNPNYLPEYIYLQLKSPEIMEEIKIRSFGAVRQALRFEDLQTIVIKKVSLEKQKEVVKEYLDLYKKYKEHKNSLDNFDINSRLQ